MGAEDFQITLYSNVSIQEAQQTLESWPQVRTVPPMYNMPSINCFVYEDDEHLVEILLDRDRDNGEKGISLDCRFALCHPDSVDECFTRLAIAFANRLHALITIRDEVPESDAYKFDIYEMDQFRDVAKRAICMKRHFWQTDFGSERARLTSAGAIKHFIVDRLNQ